MRFFLRQLWRYRAVMAVFLVLFVLLCCSGSWLIARKVAALYVMPIGLIWIIGLIAMVCPGLKRLPRLGLVLIWIVYSLAGSPYVGACLLRTIEKPFYAHEEVDAPLDALVLLGGGTVRSPGGIPALGAHGDRVLRPAMLFHAGKAPILISTGRSVTEVGEDRLLSREAAAIWEGLGVPASAIIPLDDPRNTAEEMREIAALLTEHPEWTRVGLCSSASHLRRAMALSKDAGLELIPVPTDFRSGRLMLSPLYMVPQARGFRDVQTALWEYLGALF